MHPSSIDIERSRTERRTEDATVILSKSGRHFTNAVFPSGVLVLLGFPQSAASRILAPVASPSNAAPASRLHLASPYRTPRRQLSQWNGGELLPADRKH